MSCKRYKVNLSLTEEETETLIQALETYKWVCGISENKLLICNNLIGLIKHYTKFAYSPSTTEEEQEQGKRDMHRLGVFRFYRNATRLLLLRLIDDKYILPPPKILVGSKVNEKATTALIGWGVVQKCLTDALFLESYLLGEEIRLKAEVETIKGKNYWKYIPIPESKIKKFFIIEEN